MDQAAGVSKKGCRGGRLGGQCGGLLRGVT